MPVQPGRTRLTAPRGPAQAVPRIWSVCAASRVPTRLQWRQAGGTGVGPDFGPSCTPRPCEALDFAQSRAKSLYPKGLRLCIVSSVLLGLVAYLSPLPQRSDRGPVAAVGLLDSAQAVWGPPQDTAMQSARHGNRDRLALIHLMLQHWAWPSRTSSKRLAWQSQRSVRPWSPSTVGPRGIAATARARLKGSGTAVCRED